MAEIKATGTDSATEVLERVKGYLVEIGFQNVNYDPEKKIFLFKIVDKNEQTGQNVTYPIGIGMSGDYLGLQLAIADLRAAPQELSKEKILEGLLRANSAWPEVSYGVNDDMIVSMAWSHKDSLDGKNFSTEFGRALYAARNFGTIVKYAAAMSQAKPERTFSPIYR